MFKLIFGSILFFFCACENKIFYQKQIMKGKDKYYNLRQRMVEQQIKSRSITDESVLNAMLKVPREKFVPDEYIQHAYDDTPLPIGYGQTISQPYIVALMTQLLNLTGKEKVLEIGTGSGYQAAVLAEIAKEVYSIEIIPQLAQKAKLILDEIGYKNIFIKVGDGYIGWQENAPFDAIIVTCAPDHIPQPLVEQLKVGGKMVIPVGDIVQELVFIEKNQKGEIEKKSVIPVRFVPMIREKK